MKIKPASWEIVGDFCCSSFKVSVEGFIFDGLPIIPDISTDGETIKFKKSTIRFCPFCGKKITKEKVMQ